ncbi:hypothetical protein B566_EDAN013338, partial [Ephemera danica]
YINESEDINVIIVDWGTFLQPIFRGNYALNRAATRKVGLIVADMIKYLHESLHISLENFHCVGHSLGAHVCGFTGKLFASNHNLTLNRITGLDPAGPLFNHNDTSKRLDKNDASYVDVIHTCTHIYGISQSIGHIDFYPNGGKDQEGCGCNFGFCSHSRSYIYFIESISNATDLFGWKCSSWENFTNNLCKDIDMTLMGEHVS